MAIPTNQEVYAALCSDLQKSGSKVLANIFNDTARKTFTSNLDGAVFEFPHNQPDSNYWNGVKHYSSGSRNKIRIKRTSQVESA
ncbi:MAG TPA: hypothetical protein VHY22_08130 [Chthoniobacteraceae bacterium]|jgi:hypothetical protein|nr:hypothetical protein [Chthoniobacteraceae bacterium]